MRLDAALLREWALPVDEHGDKLARGTVLVLGGAPTTPGAVLLAGEAALRIGAGRLQIATSASVATAVAVAMPESKVIPLAVDGEDRIDPQEIRDRLSGLLGRADAILIGSGMQPGSDVIGTLEVVLEACRDDTRIVIDAEAISAIGSGDGTLTARLLGRCGITPNRSELDAIVSRLVERGDIAEDVEDAVAVVAREVGAVVTSFGEIAAPDGRRWLTAPATPGLGTSGSGDVLAGLAVGACARTDDVALALCWATYVHETAGNRLSERVGRMSFLARNLVAEAPAVIAAIEADEPTAHTTTAVGN